jgi:hypothetical protein
MKKRITRTAALVLAVVILCFTMGSCSSGKKMMTLSGQSISVNMYEFFLSRQKGTLCTTYYYGSDAKSDDFWKTTISSDGKTYNDFWTSYILECTKIYLAALYLFEEKYNLSLPAEDVDEVDAKLAELVDYDGNGSKAALNAILSNYGVNYGILRDIYLLEAKINYLQEYLYGADLSKVSADVKEEYYQDNYVRFKQVFFANYYYVYETDSNGDVIYYDPNDTEGKGIILYDSSTGIRKFDSEGRALTDKNGNVIYYHEDGSIAYDEKNGVPAHQYDSNGQYKTAAYSQEELKKIYKTAEEIVEFTPAGDTDTFEKMIEKYNEDESQAEYPNGYYFLKSSKYSYGYINDIVGELDSMQTGEVRIVESDYGYHVIMKYELDKGAYSDSDNAEWFENFASGVIQWLFTKKCESYVDMIVIDEKLASGVSIIDVKPNFDY